MEHGVKSFGNDLKSFTQTSESLRFAAASAFVGESVTVTGMWTFCLNSCLCDTFSILTRMSNVKPGFYFLNRVVISK